jgi:hypothetical protein
MSDELEPIRRFRQDVPDPDDASWTSARAVLTRATDAQRAETPGVRRRRGWRPLALVAVLVLGGTSAALAAAGVFQTGAPITTQPGYAPVANVGWGAPIAGSMRLLALRVPDPAGGPPWGLGIFKTTRGLACAVTGRVVNGRLGALGIDYVFTDDGRFHPLQPAAGEGLGCTPPDARGAVFLTAPGWLDSASGEVAAAAIAQQPTCRFPGDQSPGVRCPQADLRTVFYGFLGPDARTVSYTYGGVRHLEEVSGPDGGYLIVAPAPPGVTVGRAARYGDILPLVTVHVTYDSGRTCTLQSTNPNASLPNPCQAVGYVEGPLDLPSGGAVAAQVHASYTPAAVVGLLAPGPTIAVRFTARLAITNSRYSYRAQLAPPATRACTQALARANGLIALEASTHGTITAGQTVRLLIPLEPRCTGRYTGRLYLHRAPRWDLPLPGMNRLGVDKPGNVLVTTFAINVP